MERLELVAPCHFGLESVLKREVQALGYEIASVEDGKVRFYTDEAGIARSNVFLRTAERVLVVAGEFEAVTFDELFEKTKALDWKRWIPRDGRVWVTKANSVKSRLFSPSDIQSIMKKAIVERLKEQYQTEIIPETGADYPLRVSLMKDRVTIGIDTSGVSLHKRGYRTDTVKAPISETLAAALLMLTPWKKDRILADPFCGSGTFPIEAAMMAAGIAPGMNRTFTAEKWTNLLSRKDWYAAVNEAMDQMNDRIETQILGTDIDVNAIRAAKENAARAGVDHLIRFHTADAAKFTHSGDYGFIVTNPPYGERLSDKEALKPLYEAFGECFRALPTWSLYLITSYEDAERDIGRKADRNRKIYNGMLKTYFYQFMGPKPGRGEA